MYAITQTDALAATGVVDASIFVALALAFLLVYLDLVGPLSVDEDIPVGLLATSLSLIVVFVAIVLVQVMGS